MSKPKKLRDKIVLMGFSKDLEAAMEKRLDAELGKKTPTRKPRKKVKA